MYDGSLSFCVLLFFLVFLQVKNNPPVRQSVRVSQSRTSPFMAYLNHSSIGANPVEKRCLSSSPAHVQMKTQSLKNGGVPTQKTIKHLVLSRLK